MRSKLVSLLVAGLTLVPAVDASSQARPGRAPRNAASAASSLIFATPPVVERLSNGLRVVMIPWPSPGVVSYNTVVRVGSRDEVEEGHSGFAHLFEHMMFRGTERFPAEVYEHTMQSFGADHNAFTSNDLTFYTASIPSTALAQIIDIEADRFQRLSYTEAQYRTETGAVLGEYNKSAADPMLKLEENLNELAFSRHTYRHTTIGYLRDIEAMPGYFTYSQSFFRRFYTPDNCTIVIVGDFDQAAAMRDIRAKYSAWRGRRDEPRIAVEPEPRQGAERHLDWDGESPPRMLIGYRTPSFDQGRRGAQRLQALKETAALQMIHALLFSSSAPLYQSLVVERQRVLELGSWSNQYSRDPNLFVAAITLKPGVAFNEVRDAVQTEIDKIANGRTPATRIEDVRNHLRYAMRMELEKPGDVGELVARFVAVSGDVRDVDAYVSALSQVTPDDVAHAARVYLEANRRFIVTLSPRAQQNGGAQ